MFYEPKDGHGLPKNPFNSLVIPRPIGWISSVDGQGNVNLAPYSFFNGVSYRPPTVMFASGNGEVEDDGMKDSVRNIIETGEFVHNFVTWDVRDAMNLSSATRGRARQLEFRVSEFNRCARGLLQYNAFPSFIDPSYNILRQFFKLEW